MKSSKAPRSSNVRVAVFWGDILYDTAICGPNEAVTIGRHPGNTFILDLDENELGTDESFKLIDVRSDGLDLHFDDRLDGHVRIGKQLLSLSSAKDTKHVTVGADGRCSVSLKRPDKADVTIGHMSFYFDWAEEPEIVPRASLPEKRSALLLLLFLLLCGGALWWLARLDTREEEKEPERLVTIEARKVVKAVGEDESKAPSKAAMGQPKTKDGGAQKGPEGKAQTQAPKTLSAVAALKSANVGSLMTGLTNIGAAAPNVDASNEGAQAPVAQVGTGGFTTQGLGNGGGGKTVGIGRTVGQGEGGFNGTGRLGLYGNSSVDGPGAGGGGGAVKVAGGLDSSVIESVIRRRLDRIRLCYERQLNFAPKLSGKVSVHFVIGKTGNVLSSGIIEDTMKNANVRSCILAEVKSWNFPPPEGGTLVNVDYPFVFESSARGR